MALLNEDYSGYTAKELEAKKRQILSLTASDIRDEFVAKANEMLTDIKRELRESLNKCIKAGIILLAFVFLSVFIIYNCFLSPYKAIIIAALSIICIGLIINFLRAFDRLKHSKKRLYMSESEVSQLKNTLLSEADLLIFKMHCFDMIEASIINESKK